MSPQHSVHPGVALNECEWGGLFSCLLQLLDSEGGAGAWVTPHPLCLTLCWCGTAGKKMDGSQRQHLGVLCDLEQPTSSPFLQSFPSPLPQIQWVQPCRRNYHVMCTSGEHDCHGRLGSSRANRFPTLVSRKNTDSGPILERE